MYLNLHYINFETPGMIAWMNQRNKIIIQLNEIRIYLRANLTAQRLITKFARERRKK
jgi:hypothetical protein